MSNTAENLVIPKSSLRVNCSIAELARADEVSMRKLYLYGEIMSVDNSEDIFTPLISSTALLVKQILAINEADKMIPVDERKPIMLFINSPGGELTEGFPLVSVIELSKTPVYTVNIGEWCSMAFLIGITGHKRFSLPYMTFLMHEASGFSMGKISNMEDRIGFSKKFNENIIKELVLRHSNITRKRYDAVAQKEFYMLPDEALKYGFIDEIVTDLDAIL